MSEKNDLNIGSEIFLKESGSAQDGGFPIISINSYLLSPQEIEFFEISTYNFLPTIRLDITTKNSSFRSKHLPHDGDLISVRVLPSASIYKKISCDFLILSFTSMENQIDDLDGDRISFSFFGVLNITNFSTPFQDYYKEKTSFEVLLEVSKKYNLGFVSNIEKTNDKMNWICSNKSPFEFIQEVTLFSYLDINSFFNTWIDFYYNLNFIELNRVFSIEDDYKVPKGITTGSLNLQRENITLDKYAKETNILTNHPSTKTDNKFFNRYSFINNSGDISLNYGYKRKLNIYDSVLREFKDFDIIASRTEDAEKEKIVMLGRVGEDYWKNQFKKRWNGIQYSENVFPEYLIAKNQNTVNLKDIQRMEIELNLPRINSLLYKGMIVPVRFWSSWNRAEANTGNLDDMHPTQNIGNIDRTLSGNYFISGIRLIWNKEKIFNDELTEIREVARWSQMIKISRREWTISDAPKNWSYETQNTQNAF